MSQPHLFDPPDPVPVVPGGCALFRALADATLPAWRQGLASQHVGQLRAATRDLKAAGVVPDEIPHLAHAYRLDMPGMTLTPTALAKHAPRLREAHPPRYVTRWDELEGPHAIERPPNPRAAAAYRKLR